MSYFTHYKTVFNLFYLRISDYALKIYYARRLSARLRISYRVLFYYYCGIVTIYKIGAIFAHLLGIIRKLCDVSFVKCDTMKFVYKLLECINKCFVYLMYV